jgi:hypothetical protein
LTQDGGGSKPPPQVAIDASDVDVHLREHLPHAGRDEIPLTTRRTLDGPTDLLRAEVVHRDELATVLRVVERLAAVGAMEVHGRDLWSA